jgi:GTPase
MASIFTYDPNPPVVSSPWSTPGRATPQPLDHERNSDQPHGLIPASASSSPVYLRETGITKLEPEPQEGSTEYKLHLLLRPRRTFSSTSTSDQVSGSHHPRAYLPRAGARSTNLTPSYLAQPPSTQTRQTRLQQLTTQLLWRLQQSSPFHSSSMASLVVPSLPEATLKVGIANRPAVLLPGLEESQGALYEIGVSDDGTFVGLAEDELEESLTNLKSMAASLGCVVDVLRRVIVGRCEWKDSKQSADDGLAEDHAEHLWVAEALVRPDLELSPRPARTLPATHLTLPVSHETLNGLEVQQPAISRSKVVQLRVSLTGASTSGKSSLLGTLTSSILDNGRGKSRLNLLKHRHEIASGVTSSVAQELVGYHGTRSIEMSEQSKCVPDVINYASENVSSWNDIHASAARLIFLSDSPGLPRYSKSTIRTLVSWKPHWTLFCIAADCDGRDIDVNTTTSMSSTTSAAASSRTPDLVTSPDSFSVHLELCLKLQLPMTVVVTKMDVATKIHLRQTLSKLLSVLKHAGRKPVLMSTSNAPSQVLGDQAVDLQRITTTDEAEVRRVMKIIGESGDAVVPIVLTSVMTGQGIGRLHGLLRSLPILQGAGEATIGGQPSTSLAYNNARHSTIFQVDEVFAMPPSKVYVATRSSDETNQGIVLCGYVSSSMICIGETLNLGPLLVETNHQHTAQILPLHRSTSFPGSAINEDVSSHVYSKSIPTSDIPSTSKSKETITAALWQPVRVVSLRNLRLPTRSLLAGQVGTIGVEPVSTVNLPSCDLRRARKGMILASFEDGCYTAYHSFTASFPAADFKAPDSPPLLLGGHATAYVNSTRSAVKVTSMALADREVENDLPNRDETCVFVFDGDKHGAETSQHVRIGFKFLSGVEWMTIGDRVLVIPNAAAVGPITGGCVAATGGLSGFVGTVCDLDF